MADTTLALEKTALRIASRRDDDETVARLMKTVDPNLTDERGWTYLHDAAAADSYDCLLLIVNDPRCQILMETPQGNTALHLACEHGASLQTVEILLQSGKEMVNFCNKEGYTPLHIASALGQEEIIQLLLDYGAMTDVQDTKGNTALHAAASKSQHGAVEILLHAGADPEIYNWDKGYTPFHLACLSGHQETVEALLPFVDDINHVAELDNGSTGLTLAIFSNNENLVQFLVEKGADIYIENSLGEIAVEVAMKRGHITIFKMLLDLSEESYLDENIVINACNLGHFEYEMLLILMNHELAPHFYNTVEPFYIFGEKVGGRKLFYLTESPLNFFFTNCLHIYRRSPQRFIELLYLFLLRGSPVNPIGLSECPPLVNIHYDDISAELFEEVFNVLKEFDCDVDHCSASTCSKTIDCVPDMFIASMTSYFSALVSAPTMMPYSLHTEPECLIKLACQNGQISKVPREILAQLMTMVDENCDEMTPQAFFRFVHPLRHLCRLVIRNLLRDKSCGIKTTRQFLDALKKLPVPLAVQNYLRYM